MALIRIPEEHRTIEGAARVTAFLATMDIEYERTSPDVPLAAGAPAAEVLAAFGSHDVKALLQRKSGLVGPLGAQGVEDIGDGCDAAFQGD